MALRTEMPAESIAEPISEGASVTGRSSESEVSTLEMAGLLVARRRFILLSCALATALATIVAFLLPIRYESNILMLPPQQNSSMGSALLNQLGNGALGALAPLASLTGSGLNLKNPSDMYVSLVTSRTVEDALVRRFALMDEYHEKRFSDARKELEKRTTAVAGTKDGLIRITVEDHDPKRAADLANGYIEEFQKLSASLAISEAQRRRLFFEQELQH